MTLWEKLKLMRTVSTVYNEAKKENAMGKSLLKSRTFWLNLVGLLVQVAGFVDPKYGVPAMAILNIGVRLLTDQPITGVLSPDATPPLK